MATPQTSKAVQPKAAPKTVSVPVPVSEEWAQGEERAAPPSTHIHVHVEGVGATGPAASVETTATAPVAAPVKKTRKKGQRTPLATRLAAAPSPARKAIIIEEQLKMVARRRSSILGMVTQDVLDNVDPSLLK